VKIGTWNLDHGGRSRAAREAQSDALDSVVADLWIFTEPPADLARAQGRTVSSPSERPGAHGAEPWVTLCGPGLEPVGVPAPYERLAVAARTEALGEPIVLYGSVLPWRTVRRHVPDLMRDDETAGEMFERVLADQVAEIERLRASFPGELVIWAGDFNQSLVGPNWTGSTAGRALLVDALRGLGLTAWNAESPHAKTGMRAIDLVCGDARQIHGVEVIDCARDGRDISDHNGYIIEV
jgi:hypothetical protein